MNSASTPIYIACDGIPTGYNVAYYYTAEMNSFTYSGYGSGSFDYGASTEGSLISTGYDNTTGVNQNYNFYWCEPDSEIVVGSGDSQITAWIAGGPYSAYADYWDTADYRVYVTFCVVNDTTHVKYDETSIAETEYASYPD